jgi:ATP-dependent helicase/nuclease subunit B
LLAAAWPERFGAPAAPIRERRDRWRAAPAGRVPRVLHAADREREAQLAAQWVHDRLARAAERGDPLPRLAIVARARGRARGAGALHPRAGVLIDDREGWLLSTTVAATAAMGWLDAVAGDGHHDDLLGWLDSRFVRPAGHGALRRWIERRATRHGYLRGWDGLAGDGGDPATEPVARLRGLADAQARPQPLVAHLEWLERALRWADAPRRLAADAAGRQLLTLLDGLRRAAAAAGRGAITRPLPAAEFRALLGSVLERHRFYGPIDSPVELLTPAEAAGRDFDAVVVLGASEGALPAAPAPLPLLNEPLRAMLGLPTAASAADRQQRDLALLLALPDAAAITCRSDAGDGTRPSPWVERIEAIAGDAPLAERVDAPGAPRELEACPLARPGPVFGPLPARVSVGGIERLVACPFRFLAQDGWRLREAPEAVDAPGTRERGELVHAVLERFHREVHASGLVPGPQSRGALRALLVAATDAVAVRLLGTGGGALGELAEWRATLDRYLDWACADAAGGWRWAAAEQAGAVRIDWDAPGGPRSVRVEGRLDRLDAGLGGLRVVDYKLGSPDRLRRIVAAPDRAAQLALYAWIATGHGEVAGAGYLSLRRDGVVWLPLGAPANEVLGAWRASLPRYLARIEAGAAMTASGAECDHCASRGLCRKGHWS